MNHIRVVVLFFALVISTIAIAQTPAAEANYAAENPGWLVNLDEAYAKSKASNKPILANFTGSDWCGWCKKLTASVFSQPEFKTWADSSVILLELDYPKRKQLPSVIAQQNQGLQQAFQVSGYPTVWLFDLNKDEAKNQYSISALGKTGYRPSVDEFKTDIKNMLANRAK